MARIRSIKPTFWSDEKIGVLPREVRMTFLGLISALADDHGRLVGTARIVRGAVYPYDDDISIADVEGHLAQLAAAGRILRYQVNGSEYIAIQNWARHQRVDRPSPSLLPPPPGTIDESSSSDRRTIPTDRKGEGGEGKGGENTPTAGAGGPSPAEEQLKAQCGEHYPAVLAFLDERPSHLRAEWAKDLLGYIGPATGNLPEDLARAATDGKLADPPVTNARTLRIFLASCREERLAPARAAAAPSGNAPKADPVANAAWQTVLAMIPKWHAREITTETFATMAPGMKAGLSAIGGFQTLVETKAEKRVWLKQDFVAAFRAAPKEPEVRSA